MTDKLVGYVVVERNADSGEWQYLNSSDLHKHRDDAQIEADESNAIVAKYKGKRPEYRVASLFLPESV